MFFEESIFRCHHQLFLELFTALAQRPMISAGTKNDVYPAMKSRFVKTVKKIIQEKIFRSQQIAVGNDNALFEYMGHREYLDTLQVNFYIVMFIIKKNKSLMD